MNSIKNEKLSNLKIIKSSIDELDEDLADIAEPLTKKSGAFFFVENHPVVKQVYF